MAIPSIDPYELPTADELPEARVDWKLDASRCVLLVHDMQKYFIDAYVPGSEPISTVVANLVRLRNACVGAGIPVVYTMQPGDQHPARRGLLSEFWGEGMSVGRDTEVIDELVPGPGDIQVTKWRYSAFQRTDLREILAHTGRDQIIVTGVYAHMGCMISAADAFMNDVAPFMAIDATADFSRTEHLTALEYIAKRVGRVQATDELLDAIAATAPEQGRLVADLADSLR